MLKKILSIIGISLAGIILLFYLMTTFLATGSDWKALLIFLTLTLPFILLVIPAIFLMKEKKVLPIIFLVLSGIATIFLGLMCLQGGLPFLGIIALPLSFIIMLLYIITIVLILINK